MSIEWERSVSPSGVRVVTGQHPVTGNFAAVLSKRGICTTGFGVLPYEELLWMVLEIREEAYRAGFLAAGGSESDERFKNPHTEQLILERG